MTKEELEKEAEEYAKHVRYTKTQWNCHEIFDEDLENAYIAGAESKEKYIAELEKEITELKAQVRGYLINFADNDLVKVLRDCIIQNKKLSSQEQNQLSAWVECAMDFGSNLDECADQLTKVKEIIKDLLGSENTSCEEEMYFEIRHKAEDFIKE